MNDQAKRMLAAAIVEQAVIDTRIAKHHNLVNHTTLEANKNLPKRLPQLLEADDLFTLKSFINSDLESFLDSTGLNISADTIRRGIKTNYTSFKKYCSESSIQSYERRWKPNPLHPDQPKRKRKRIHGGKG